MKDIALHSANCLESGFSALTTAINALGFDSIVYTAIPRTLGVVGQFNPVFLQSSDFSIGFLKHYSEAGLVDHDFTIPRIADGIMCPADWTEEVRSGRLNRQQIEVVNIAACDYNITSAISIPLYSDPHILAGATVVSDAQRGQFKRLKFEKKKELVSLAKLFNSFVFSDIRFRQKFYEPFVKNLSRDERCMLELIATGKPLKLTKFLYGISPSRSGNILSRLYKKTKVNNASELSFLLGRHRILEML